MFVSESYPTEHPSSTPSPTQQNPRREVWYSDRLVLVGFSDPRFHAALRNRLPKSTYFINAFEGVITIAPREDAVGLASELVRCAYGPDGLLESGAAPLTVIVDRAPTGRHRRAFGRFLWSIGHRGKEARR